MPIQRFSEHSRQTKPEEVPSTAGNDILAINYRPELTSGLRDDSARGSGSAFPRLRQDRRTVRTIALRVGHAVRLSGRSSKPSSQKHPKTAISRLYAP